MKIIAMLVIACLGASATGWAGQAGQAAPKPKREGPRFEVVSVKPCLNSYYGGDRSTQGRMHLECFTVENMVTMAFKGSSILPHELQALVKGGPAWVKSRRFVVEATIERPPSGDSGAPSILDVLRERFGLKFHEETQIEAMYDLIQSPGGAKLRPAKEGGCTQLNGAGGPPQDSRGQVPSRICGGFSRSPGGGVDANGITMRDLCLRMSSLLDRDVYDATGLRGVYDIHLDATLDALSPYRARGAVAPPASDGAIPEASEPGGSAVTALHKLGLQLKPSKRPARLIVIDQVELPSAN